MKIVESSRPRRVRHQPISDLAAQDQQRQGRDQRQRRHAGNQGAPQQDDGETDDRGDHRVLGRNDQRGRHDQCPGGNQGSPPADRLRRPVEHGSPQRGRLRLGLVAPHQHGARHHGERGQRHADPHRPLRSPRHRDGHRRIGRGKPPTVEPSGDLPWRTEPRAVDRCLPTVVVPLAEDQPASVRTVRHGGGARRAGPVDRNRRWGRGGRGRIGCGVAEDDPIDIDPGGHSGSRGEPMGA